MQAVRYYGAWGDVRVGNTTGPSVWRYCANLGHVADDESGFVYMRARYYEPATGRFVSEDPARADSNWFEYCTNRPIDRLDETGKNPIVFAVLFASFMGLAAILQSAWLPQSADQKALKNFIDATLAAVGTAMGVCAALNADEKYQGSGVDVVVMVGSLVTGVIILCAVKQLGPWLLLLSVENPDDSQLAGYADSWMDWSGAKNANF